MFKSNRSTASTALTVGSYAIRYAFAGDVIGFNAAANGAGTLRVISALVAPSITSTPSSQTVIAGNNVTFTAAANGNPTPTVQWQVSTNGGTSYSNISGATGTTLTLTAAATQNGARYRAVFTNSVGSATTSAATLTVQSAPTISTQPVSQAIRLGNNVTFTAAAAGNPTPTVQWQVSANGGLTFTNISGAISNTYQFTTSSSQNGNLYRAVYTNSVGTVATTAATLTVQVAPSVTTNPVSQTVVAGTNVTFTAGASGNPPPTVQWQVSTNGGTSYSNISGATNTTLIQAAISTALVSLPN
ncbi:immunoglobulin domain-containing protein [Anatilimnocola floriformis]|uniref:immunoglobulin domain-containing protein n=1 Tax=Anatilimnocola floriformis TaxID=2948575 RepID=UPI0020C276DC|nr:immunoglobulin domain-containing protein [Anatilimnocola floriformis]